MFIISLTYKMPLDEVDKHLPAHVSFLNDQYASGHFIASGRKVPRTGGIILSNMQSRDALNEVLQNDPFMQYGVAEYDIVEFVPSMVSEEMGFLLC